MFLEGIAGKRLSLDLRALLGERVEIQCFQFAIPPLEFRLVRNEVPLQDWQSENTEIYDLQHPSYAQEWNLHGHRFTNDLFHRQDRVTCGVLSRDLGIETRGLGLPISIFVWPRDVTIMKRAHSTSLPIIQT